MDEKEYIKGFNRGYTLMRHRPKLTEKLMKSLKDRTSDRDQGFLAGADEVSRELQKEHFKKKSNYTLPKPKAKGADKNRNPDKDRDFGRD